MKYCQKCGSEIMDEAVICVHCGCQVANPVQKTAPADLGKDGLAVASKAFLILSTVISGFVLLPLAWCLPITITICNRMKRGERVGTGIKVCALIFVSLVAGILLLCRSDNDFLA